MTDTNEAQNDAPAEDSKAKKRGGGLNSMLLADLKSMAGGLGIKGAGSMKKAQLVEAIKAAQQGGQQGGQPGGQPAGGQAEPRQERRERRVRREPEATADTQDKQPEQDGKRDRQEKQDAQPDRQEGQRGERAQDQQKRQQGQQRDGDRQQGRQQGQQQGGGQQGGGQQGQQNQQRNQNQQNQQAQQAQHARQNQADQDQDQDDDGDGDGSRRNRRRRGRDRDRTRSGGRNEPDTTILEDDVLVPAAGILDVLDNYAFVRTSGYLAGADDVYLSLSMVRKYGLRRGDAVVGQVRQPREGERKEKFNPMVRIDSVNGADPDAGKNRVEFAALTPVHPTDRLRLETGHDEPIGRVLDIVTPLGKGQRGLVVAPAQAGKTTVLRAVASAITHNNPECHVMVVLVDERPEEVTDFERSVKGEVVASTFDRAPSDHTTVSELAVERAKRLVELGHDVVVLVDGLSRLGRAYNIAGTTSGRTLAGGVDAAALTATKRLFGAARNIEDGGSLTVLATVLVDSGSSVDDLVLQELTGTESLVLRLDGDLAEAQVFPAVDLGRSGTRHEAVLVGEQEHAVLEKLRRGLTGKDGKGVAGLLERLGKTQTNYELLSTVQRSS